MVINHLLTGMILQVVNVALSSIVVDLSSSLLWIRKESCKTLPCFFLTFVGRRVS